ncbi:hypothetical protein MJL33_31325, partial [Salmonella enterica subsp. enterica serovar Kentucky]|nr:hypothetical protein [Salmonella enterica subsp. enterica serovar Kentucky]
EWVLLVSGSSARQAHRSELSPVDLCVIGIVDEVVAGGKVVFHFCSLNCISLLEGFL